MRARAKRSELLRLQDAFESEAAQFHDLSLSILYLTQQQPYINLPFRSTNHLIMLWQYYGHLEEPNMADRLIANLRTSNVPLAGVRGSEFSCFALLEGPRVKHFVRMATRAGSIFSKGESYRIETRALRDFASNSPKVRPIFVSNRNPLAIWLNYVLHHLGKTHPRYLPEVKVDIDPFAASLFAIDKLLKTASKSSKTRRPSGLEQTRFRIALSFPGQHRPYIEKV